MEQTFRFQCSTCGEVHEGSPSFSFNSPSYYIALRKEDRKKPGTSLDSDFCTINNEDFFIRVILKIPIHGAEHPFLWGIWISVSKENYKKYYDQYENKEYQDTYFGWFSNRLPYYPNTLNIKTWASVDNSESQRPVIELDLTEHPLSVDYQQGISWEKAKEIAELVMHKN